MVPANSHAAITSGLKAAVTKVKTSTKKTRQKLNAVRRAHSQTRCKLDFSKQEKTAQKAKLLRLHVISALFPWSTTLTTTFAASAMQ